MCKVVIPVAAVSAIGAVYGPFGVCPDVHRDVLRDTELTDIKKGPYNRYCFNRAAVNYFNIVKDGARSCKKM
eukprot:11833581-Karenia_brevis.AAC.1